VTIASSVTDNTRSNATAALTSIEVENYVLQINRLRDDKDEIELRMTAMQKRHNTEVNAHLDSIKRLETKLYEQKQEYKAAEEK
jgi:predicted RNase H-like nuclease (RuvC/YqgF family)